MMDQILLDRMVKAEVTGMQTEWRALGNRMGGILGTGEPSAESARLLRNAYGLKEQETALRIAEVSERANKGYARVRGIDYRGLNQDQLTSALLDGSKRGRDQLNYSINRSFVPLKEGGKPSTLADVIKAFVGSGQGTVNGVSQGVIARGAESEGQTLRVITDPGACKYCKMLAEAWDDRDWGRINYPKGFHGGGCRCTMTWRT